MKYKLLCQNSVTGAIYDITELAGTVKYDTYINGQPGKLTVTIQQDLIKQQDPAKALQITCGSAIDFYVNDSGIFAGYVFTMGTDASGVYKITAYDQMRYLKNKGIYITANQTASQIFEMVCKDNYQDSRWEVITPSTFVPPAYIHTDKTLYEVIAYGLEHANVAEMNKPAEERQFYFIKDKFGVLQFTNINNNVTPFVIGDGSLLTNYQYDISIDKDTFNTVVIYQEDEKTGQLKPRITDPVETQKLWGRLQTVKKVDTSLNEAQIRELGELMLKWKNRETKTMRLEALGVSALVAGSAFIFESEKLQVNSPMWIAAASHTYKENYHTMSLEVYA